MAKILVVEDEGIVAQNIRSGLKKLGYTVPAVVSSGEEAIRKAEETRPDLVLMDVVLKGSMDGVRAAEQIYSRFNIPVVYLTAYSDNNTLERAKLTEPFGYVLKPFEIREIRSAIEIALSKHKAEVRLKEKKDWFAKTLESINDAVILCDTKGLVRFVNPNAESLAGWKQEDVLGKDLTKVLKVINEQGKDQAESLIKKAFKEGTVINLSNHAALVAKDGTKTRVDVSVTPIKDGTEKITGIVLAFRETGEREPSELEALKTEKVESGAGAESKEDVLISLIVAASSALVREGIYGMLRSETSIEIVAETSDGSKIIPLVGQKRPDVLLIDTAMPKLDIQGTLESIRRERVQTNVILLLRSLDEKFVADAISLGVRGFLKDVSNREQLAQAIRTVWRGEIWVDVGMITKVLTRLKPSKKGELRLLKPDLTKREEDVVKLILKGYSNKKISEKLFISNKTVKAHLRNIFRKFDVRSRFQLAVELHGTSSHKP